MQGRVSLNILEYEFSYPVTRLQEYAPERVLVAVGQMMMIIIIILIIVELMERGWMVALNLQPKSWPWIDLLLVWNCDPKCKLSAMPIPSVPVQYIQYMIYMIYI